MDLKIITIDEWNSINDALYYAKKSYRMRTPIDAPTSDEERLKSMEMYLKVAIGLCGKIRERWEANL